MSEAIACYCNTIGDAFSTNEAPHLYRLSITPDFVHRGMRGAFKALSNWPRL
jgi:hypothetical protein